jgi:hypothetical protein
MDLIEKMEQVANTHKRKRARSLSPVRPTNNQFQSSNKSTKPIKKISKSNNFLENKSKSKPQLSIVIEQRDLELGFENNRVTKTPLTPRNLNSKIKLSRQNSIN